MAFTPFHNINSATDGQEVELIAVGDGANNIKSILLTNIDSAAITVDLFYTGRFNKCKIPYFI